MRKKTHIGIEETDFPNYENGFRRNPGIADKYKNQFPNETEILLEGYDSTEWTDWSHAYAHWYGYVEAMKTVFKNNGMIDEADICDILLRHAHLLTCSNCGEKLEEQAKFRKGDKVAVLHIDPGCCNYPVEPDEPATAYFECIECAEKKMRK